MSKNCHRVAANLAAALSMQFQAGLVKKDNNNRTIFWNCQAGIVEITLHVSYSQV